MRNKIIFAPAGGRKTQRLIELIQEGKDKKILVITYTSTGQEVLRQRINKTIMKNKVTIVGWYQFLLHHIIYPYSSDYIKNLKVTGFKFLENDNFTSRLKGINRYISKDGEVYSSRINLFSNKIIEAGDGDWIDRLEKLYNEIYIDELQDLAGNDLDIINLLFKSKIRIVGVGDVRQSIYQTSRLDTKYKKFNGINKISWYKNIENSGKVVISNENETWRCNQQIIDFADSVIPPKLNFPRTISKNLEVTGHDGVFVINKDQVMDYYKKYTPLVLRTDIRTKVPDGIPSVNFGKSKGLTVDRTLIYSTRPFREFLKDRTKTLANKSISALYVALTRAKYSVAIVVDKVEDYDIPCWTNHQS